MTGARLRRIAHVAHNEVLVLRADAIWLVLPVVLPIPLMVVTRPAYDTLATTIAGSGRADGAALAVPGFAVLSATNFVNRVGTPFFKEHQWNTWSRLRTTPLSNVELLAGKVLPLAVLIVGQFALVLVFGSLATGLDLWAVAGPIAVTSLLFSACMLALGLAFVAASPTLTRFVVSVDLATFVFGIFGTALMPPTLLASWAHPVSVVTPSYWAMQAYRSLLLDGGGYGAVAVPLAVLASFTFGLVVTALALFRVDREKTW